MDSNELQRLLNDQDGVVTQRQVGPLGYSRKRIEYLLKSGQWQRVLHGVYAVTTGPLTRRMTLIAALLYGGSSAVLSHRTAGEEWRMLQIDASAPVHITVRYGLSALDQAPTFKRSGSRPVPHRGEVLHPGVVVHRSRAIAHTTVKFELPRTSRADTAIDLAVSEPTPATAFGTFIAAATNGRVRLYDLRRRMGERTPRRYVRPLTQALELLASGVQSVLEYRYAVDIEEGHGLPVGRRQRPVIVDGHTLFEDVEYEVGDTTLVVRLDGRKAHSMPGIPFRDRRRDNAAELAGKRHVVFGWDEVDLRSCEVADEVRQILEPAGWTGWRPCAKCPSPVG